MDALASAAVSSETVAPNPIAARRDPVVRRYQPLVVVTLAAAIGIVWDRFGARSVLASAAEPAHEWNWFALAWSSCACCLALWLIAWSRKLDRTAGWILLVAAGLAGSTWHELNWFLFDRAEIGRYARAEPEPVCLEAIACESPERVTAPTATPLRA